MVFMSGQLTWSRRQVVFAIGPAGQVSGVSFTVPRRGVSPNAQQRDVRSSTMCRAMLTL